MYNIKIELENCGLLPLFEIEVLNKETRQTDYIICNIYANDKVIYCQRVGLTEEEEESKLIATSSIDIDSDWDLDYHLETLHEIVINEIIDSEFYRLK